MRIIDPRGVALEASVTGMTYPVCRQKPASFRGWRAVLTMFFVALAAAESSSEVLEVASK